MADLDVSDVLDDPDFQSSFQIVRASASVSEQGRNVIVPSSPQTVFGVIQPAGAQDLARLPDVSMQRGALKIWTRFPLNVDAPGQQSDNLIIGSSAYTVTLCDPWNYGSGYFASVATLTTFS